MTIFSSNELICGENIPIDNSFKDEWNLHILSEKSAYMTMSFEYNKILLNIHNS